MQPTYRAIGDHTEVVELEYDAEKISLEKLLKIFWEIHDPTMPHKPQYKSLILCPEVEQKKLCEDNLKRESAKFRRPVLTEIGLLNAFYEAESYHQKYLLRQNHSVARLLGEGIRTSSLVSSPLAAKLNALAGGFTTVDAVVRDCKLTPEQEAGLWKNSDRSVVGASCDVF